MESEARKQLPRDLGDGLTLRWAREEDGERLAAHNRLVFAEPNGEPDDQAALQTRELFSADHPTASPGDHVLVEESSTGKIVSSICLIPQTWSYAGIPFGVSRPELVATESAYRERGLVRAQMDVLHALSAERGDLMQAITGIPYFYRQFGYEPALITTKSCYGAPLARAVPDDPPYLLRPASETDIPTVMTCYGIATKHMLMAAVREEAVWKWELAGRLHGSDYVQTFWIIAKPDGASAGFVAHQEGFDTYRSILWATAAELLDGESWPSAAPIVTEHLRSFAAEEAAKTGNNPANIGFDWGYDRPFVQLQPQVFQSTVRAFSWLIRIPNLAAFLRHIKPALTERLRQSPFQSYSGELVLTFYRSGLKLTIVNGEVAEIQDFKPESFREASAGFPDKTFYYLLLGSRTFEELEYAFPDCFVGKPSDRALLATLFPKQPSAIWPV